MANNHSTLTGLFTDIADAIREKTGRTGEVNTILEEQDIELYSMGSSFNNSWGELPANSIEMLTIGETYIITFDGIKYNCVAYDWHGVSIGDSRLHPDDEGSSNNSINPENVPFYICTYEEENWLDGIDVKLDAFSTLDNIGIHTIKIEHKISDKVNIIADNFPEEIAAIDTQENLDSELATQDSLIDQIMAALEAKDLEIQAKLAEANASWAGELTFTSTSTTKYNTSTYYTEAGCSLAVDKQKGMAFVTIQGGTSTSYEKIYFVADSLPEGVTMQSYNQYFYGSTGNTKDYYTVGLTGITGKINVVVDFNGVSSTYDYTKAALTVTYA